MSILTKVKQRKNDILLYLFLLILMLILNRASVAGRINPFGFSFAFSLVMLQKNAFLVAIFYFLTSNLLFFSIKNLICSAVVALSLIALYLFFKLIKRPINIVSTFIFAIFSQAGYAYFNFTSPTQILQTIAMVALSMMFIYICYQCFSAIFYRGISSRFTISENICLSLFLIALFSGLYGIYIGEICLTTSIVVFVLLLASAVLPKINVVYLATIAGFGMAFASANVFSVATYVTYGVLAAALSGKNKFIAPLAVATADLVMGMFLNVYAFYSYLNLCFIIFACVVYLCIPKKVISYLYGFSYSYDYNLANEYILEGQRKNIKLKLEQTSNLFKQMQTAYRNLSIGEIDKKSAADALTEDVTKRHCSKCPSYQACLANPSIKSAITTMFELGIEKQKVTLIDANNLLTTTCRSLNALTEEINQSLKIYFEYEKTIKNEDKGKMLLSEQLGGTSELLSELANLSIGGQTIDHRRSKELLDELTINKVIVSEALVLSSGAGVEKVIVVVRNSDVLNENISVCLKAVLKLNFAICSQEMTRIAGWSVLCFEPAPRYKVQIGFATKSETPSSPSGDNYSFLKISNLKLLFALSDGIGHGERANQISAAALNLIESFYKSGFSSQTILSSVNKLLLPSQDERFTSLDACIVDLDCGVADFVKIGASVSLVKSETTTKMVEGSSVPLGIIPSVNASIKKEVLKNNDIIVIASDGIVDTFDSPENYLSWVNNEKVINVQMLAQNILEEAESRTSEHNDDKTVIAIKITER